MSIAKNTLIPNSDIPFAQTMCRKLFWTTSHIRILIL